MIRATRPRTLVVGALLAGTVSWAVLRIADAHGTPLPVIPLSVPAALVAIAVVVLGVALSMRRRLRGGPDVRPVDPIGATRVLALAKGCSATGALLTGHYLGIVVAVVPDVAMLPLSRVIVPAVSALGAVALTVAGLVLERVCRVEPPDDEQPLPSA